MSVRVKVLDIKVTANGRFAVVAIPVSDRVVAGSELDLELAAAPVPPVTTQPRAGARPPSVRHPSDVDVLG